MTINALAKEIFEANAAKGFWDRERPLTETTMLIITELAEAIEEERAGRPAVWYQGRDGDALEPGDPDLRLLDEGTMHNLHDLDGYADFTNPYKPEGVDVELIDALIRLLDLLGSRGVDVEELLRQKLAYNKQARGIRHGKAF